MAKTPPIADTPAGRRIKENLSSLGYPDSFSAEDVITAVQMVQDSLSAADKGIATAVECPPPSKGLDFLGIHPENAAHLSAGIKACASLLSTEASVNLFGYEGMLPDSTYSNPRLGFLPSKNCSRVAEAPVGGHYRYQCELTEKKFDLPPGAPVPALIMDSSIGQTGDTYTIARLVHPEIYAQGPRAVYRALWGRVSSRLDHAINALSLAIEDAASACQLAPEDFKGAPETAFFCISSTYGNRGEQSGWLHAV